MRYKFIISIAFASLFISCSINDIRYTKTGDYLSESPSKSHFITFDYGLMNKKYHVIEISIFQTDSIGKKQLIEEENINSDNDSLLSIGEGILVEDDSPIDLSNSKKLQHIYLLYDNERYNNTELMKFDDVQFDSTERKILVPSLGLNYTY